MFSLERAFLGTAGTSKNRTPTTSSCFTAVWFAEHATLQNNYRNVPSGIPNTTAAYIFSVKQKMKKLFFNNLRRVAIKMTFILTRCHKDD